MRVFSISISDRLMCLFVTWFVSAAIKGRTLTVLHKTVFLFHPLHQIEVLFLFLFISGSPSLDKMMTPGQIGFALMSADLYTDNHGYSPMILFL